MRYNNIELKDRGSVISQKEESEGHPLISLSSIPILCIERLFEPLEE